MTDADRPKSTAPAPARPELSANSPAVAIFTVVLLAGLGAAGAVYGLSDLIGLGVAAVIAVAGAFVATMAAGKPTTSPDAKANALLEAVSADDASAEPPSRFRSEPWGSLYRRAVGYSEAQRTATLAVQEVEALRRQLEGKPTAPALQPAASAPGEPSEPVGAASAVESYRFEPGPTHEESDLVGASMAAGDGGARTEEAVARALGEALDPIRQELSAMERDLEPVVRALRSSAGAVTAGSSRHASPAKMVDILVQTAADGIEDLAAGLMRANELASVAERVTNRATLLALNAALEATRSGSEAFASIAEETRRLAEYAREATDTISRLSSEIELKVGETIGAIQTTSEDAKAAVATLGSSGGTESAGTAGVDPEAVATLELLLTRVRSLRGNVVVPAAAPAAARSAAVSHAAPVEQRSLDEEPVESAHDAVASEVETGVTVHVVEPAEAEQNAPTSSSRGYGDIRIDDGPSSDGDAGLHAPAGDPPAADAAAPGTPAGDEPREAPRGLPVVPKIPDWLEGLEPPDRR
jgi:hypothetical protein